MLYTAGSSNKLDLTSQLNSFIVTLSLFRGRDRACTPTATGNDLLRPVEPLVLYLVLFL